MSEPVIAPRRFLSLRIEILVLALVVLLLAQGFNSFLSTIAFEEKFEQSLLSGSRVVAGELPQTLERALKFGKRIDNFFGLTQLVQQFLQENSQFTQVLIFSPTAEVISSSTDVLQGTKVPAAWLTSQTSLSDGGQRILLFPVQDGSRTRVATVAVALDTQALEQRVGEHVRREVQLSLMVMAGAAAFLIVAMRLFVPIRQDLIHFPRKRLFTVVFLTMILSQLAFMLLATMLTREALTDATRTEVSQVTAQLEANLEKLFDKGLQLEQLGNVEIMLAQVLKNAPAIESLTLTAPDNQALHRARAETDPASAKKPAGYELFLGRLLADEQISIRQPLHKKTETGEDIQGYLVTRVSGSFQQRNIQSFIFNSLTVLLISVLFITEVLLFFLLFIQQRHLKKDSGATDDGYGMIRTVMSVFLFGFMMSVSFIPLQMQKLLETVRPEGLSVEVLSSLPVSAEMLCGLMAVMITGGWSDRRGWHQPFLVGVILSAAGLWYSGVVAQPWGFILARGISGFGYGLTWMAAQNFLLGKVTPAQRARSLASLAAGIMVGYLCGNAVGAMLADRIGYTLVLQTSAGFTLATLPFVLFFMRQHLRAAPGNDTIVRPGIAAMLTFFSNAKVQLVVLLSIVPIAVCQVGFIVYAVPVCLERLEVSQANIGRTIMIFGMTLVYVGPWLARYINGPRMALNFLIVGGCLGGGRSPMSM